MLRLYGEGRVSVGRAAELLDTNVHEVYRLAQAQGMDTGSSEVSGSADTLARLLDRDGTVTVDR